jgi:hypothetical protein
MFKRVEKRRRKQEEEEELGLDEDMKEVLGMNDTDSDESESDSDSDSDGNEAEEEAQEEDAGEADEDEDSSDEEDAAEEPPISVREALKDPVYVVSLQPNIKACIVCPGKLIKSAEILTRHRESKARHSSFSLSSLILRICRRTKGVGVNLSSLQNRQKLRQTAMHGTC